MTWWVGILVSAILVVWLLLTRVQVCTDTFVVVVLIRHRLLIVSMTRRAVFLVFAMIDPLLASSFLVVSASMALLQCRFGLLSVIVICVLLSAVVLVRLVLFVVVRTFVFRIMSLSSGAIVVVWFRAWNITRTLVLALLKLLVLLATRVVFVLSLNRVVGLGLCRSAWVRSLFSTARLLAKLKLTV